MKIFLNGGKTPTAHNFHDFYYLNVLIDITAYDYESAAAYTCIQ